MDVETVATKENIITTAEKDNAAEVNDNEEAIYEELHLYQWASTHLEAASRRSI